MRKEDEHLIIPNIPKLKENEIYIQYVHDGEYSFNIFGGAYTDLDLFLDQLSIHYKVEKKDLIIFKYLKNSFYICKKWIYPEGFKLTGYHYSNLAYITINTINPLKFHPGY